MLGSALEQRRVESNGHRSGYLQKPVAQRLPRGGGNSECKMITDFLTEAGITHLSTTPPPPPANRPGRSQSQRPQQQPAPSSDRHEGPGRASTIWQEGGYRCLSDRRHAAAAHTEVHVLITCQQVLLPKAHLPDPALLL